MISLETVRDLISSLDVTEDDHVYMSKLDAKKNNRSAVITSTVGRLIILRSVEAGRMNHQTSPSLSTGMKAPGRRRQPRSCSLTRLLR